MSESNINRNYKDRLLNFIFGKEENRKWTLQLYNAVNGSSYTDESLIEFNTLNDVLYMGMKNDTSFLIADTMNVYEHQSTYNPNMPLRMMDYVSDLYSSYIKKNGKSLYSSKLITLPLPKLVVFYNGKKEIDDETILKLSDSFPKDTDKEPDIEVKVRMININHGRNEKILLSCKPLEEYSWFIKEVDNNLSKQNERDISSAIDAAVNAIPEDFVIRDFILENQSEVKGMLDTEYNEAEIKELFKAEGREEGIEVGALKLKTKQICKNLQKGKTPDQIADCLCENLSDIQHIIDVARDFAPDYDPDKVFNVLSEE